MGIEIKWPQDSVPFHPYVTIKDVYAFCVYLILFSWFLFFMPNYMGHPDNYIPANPLVTPSHIVPEWYFLPWYAILRAIPDKLGGTLAMFAAVMILFVLPWLDTSKVKSMVFKPVSRLFFWVFAADCILLGFCGANNPEGIWVIASRLGTIYYFAYFLVVMPLLGKFERPRPRPASIAEAILKGGGSVHAHAAAAQPMEKA